MKKILTTIFIHFYLFSALGYTSVQHYCQMMQNTVQGGVEDCCCGDIEAETDSCHIDVNMESESCCEAEKEQKPDLKRISTVLKNQL